MIADELSGGPHFEAFCERYIQHTKGRWAGQPLILEPWQREFWWEALEVDPATGLRIYQEVGLGLPRKNSKSTMAAAAGLYLLTADGEAEPEVYIGAGAQHQANVVYGQARSMVRRSRPLLNYVPTPGRYSMQCHRNGGILRSLSSDGALQHGLSPSANIIDEIHAHKNGELYTALTTATGAREQPFTFWITTAGVAGAGILAELYSTMTEGPGQLEDRGFLRIYRDRVNGVLIYWYGAPRDADPADPEVWRSCNPASWLQDLSWLKGQYQRLAGRGALLEWRRYHLNQFVETEESWLPPGAWEACRGDAELDPELPVGVGVQRRPGESGAVVVVQRQGDRVVVRSKVFPVDRDTGSASSSAIREHLKGLRDVYPAAMSRIEKTRRPKPGPAFAFDRWSFTENAELLELDGLNMVDFPRHASTLGPASTLTYDLITGLRLEHDRDPVLAEHVATARATLTERGMMVTMAKRITERQSSACMALVTAVAMAMQEAPVPFVRKATKAVSF